MLSNAAKTQYTSRYNTFSAVKLNLEIGFGIPSGKEQNQRKKRINTDFRGLFFMQLHYAYRLCTQIDKKDVNQGND